MMLKMDSVIGQILASQSERKLGASLWNCVGQFCTDHLNNSVLNIFAFPPPLNLFWHDACLSVTFKNMQLMTFWADLKREMIKPIGLKYD